MHSSSLRSCSHSKRRTHFSHKAIGFISIIALLFWTTGAPFTVLFEARAANVESFKDTLTDSTPSTAASHVLDFVGTTTLNAGETIKIQFDSDTDAFDLTPLVAGDITITGMTRVAACTGGPTDEVTAVIDSTAPDENVTFTVCGAGDTIPVGAKTITFGNAHIVNPSGEGSYKIHITYGPSDEGETRVAIVNRTTLSATVDQSFLFTVGGVASSSSVNGDSVQTSTTTDAVTFPLGLLASGTPKLVAHDLFVLTNAQQGFVVTIQQTQNLLSSDSADIDLFRNGASAAVPIAWEAPSAVPGNENTYGHYGITSEDADLNSDEFGTALYAGNFSTTSRVVFSNSGPADGVTANVGRTRIGFKIQVSSLQEASQQYTNVLYYVATPTF